MRYRNRAPWLLVTVISAAALVIALTGTQAQEPPPPAPPPAPQWIGLFDLKDRVGVKWLPSPTFKAVRIYRSLKSPGAEFELLTETQSSSHVDDTVVPWQTYLYRLTAVGADGTEGPASSEKSITVLRATLKPAAPPEWAGFLQLKKGVGLKWLPRLGEDIIAYNLYRRGPGESDFRLLTSTTDTSYPDRKVEAGKEYVYVLTALGSAFTESSRSQELRVVHQPETEKVGAAVTWRPRKTRLVKIITEGDEPLLRPVDVVIGPRTGRIYLSDSGNNKVQIFNREGRFLSALGGPDSQTVRFQKLLGLAVDARESLYCVDAGRSTVVVVDLEGRVERRINLKQRYVAMELGIMDAALTEGGGLWVSDNINHRLLKAGEKQPETIVGGPGTAWGRLGAPTFCAASPDGYLYVSEALNGRVQVFDAEGTFVRGFGRYAWGIGGFGRPKGIAFGGGDDIYIADSWQNVVQVFGPAGDFRAVITDEEGRLLDLGSPNGITYGGDGRLYIAERLASRLQIREIVHAP